MTDSGFLNIDGVSKRFGGLQALDDITIHVEKGTIHGIIGPNGAGKTTLFNVITGMFGADRGEIRLEGVALPWQKPHKLVPMGIARTFQNIRLFKSMTVLENVLIGQHIHTPTPVLSIILNGPAAKRGEAAAELAAREALAFVGLESKADEIVKNLAYGQQRLVEFARALAAKPKIILLDEPAAGMNPQETKELTNMIKWIRNQFKLSVLLIEHDMSLVMGVCERIYVLEYGFCIAEGKPDDIKHNKRVIEAYLGGEAS